MMFRRPTFAALIISAAASPAGAQWIVSDPGHTAITSSSWAAQASSMAKQISEMVRQYQQLQQTYNAITGVRNMQGLAALTYQQRNYLPPEYSGLVGDGYNSYQSLMYGNVVLSPEMMARLSPEQRQIVEASRRGAAIGQAASRGAYQNASTRFHELQRLIDEVGRAGDAKAIADLQGRIAGEQAMLANEQNKLLAMQQAAAADRYVEEVQRQERAIRNWGTLGDLPAVRY